MLHTLDYSRYEDDVRNMAVRNGIDLIEVNPAYTSRIAKMKYCRTRKIPVHNGAAYVIARAGLFVLQGSWCDREITLVVLCGTY